jgi:hypothetical protein
MSKMSDFIWTHQTDIDSKVYSNGLKYDKIHKNPIIHINGTFTNLEKTRLTGIMNDRRKNMYWKGTFILYENEWRPHGLCDEYKILIKPMKVLMIRGESHTLLEVNKLIKYEGEFTMGRKGKADSIYTDGKKYSYKIIDGVLTQILVKGSWKDCRKHGVFSNFDFCKVPYCKIYTYGTLIYNQQTDYESEYRYKEKLYQDDIQQILLEQFYCIYSDLEHYKYEYNKCLSDK